jgi:hypothetical protein
VIDADIAPFLATEIVVVIVLGCARRRNSNHPISSFPVCSQSASTLL